VVVSVGSGPGFEARQVERLRPTASDWRVVLVDSQRGMLAQTGERQAPGSVSSDRVLADAVELPLPDESVDALLSLGVLCCLTDEGAERAAGEAWRVVRPGGVLALTVPRWRGRTDDARHTRLGFVRVAGTRPGRSVFRKHK
jgi:ubiquinone/menaquinone biosynthesis C-methylase UbiE